MWAGWHTHTISFRGNLPEGLTTPMLYVDGTGHVLVKGPGGGDVGCPHRLAPGGVDALVHALPGSTFTSVETQKKYKLS